MTACCNCGADALSPEPCVSAEYYMLYVRVPMNSAEVSATLCGWGAYALDLCRARAVQAQRPGRTKEGEVSDNEGLGSLIKTQEAGDVPATFSFRFTEDALYVTGTAPMGEDQALIIADVLGECFGAQMLKNAAAFATEQEAGNPRSTGSGSWSRCAMTQSPVAKAHPGRRGPAYALADAVPSPGTSRGSQAAAPQPG